MPVIVPGRSKYLFTIARMCEQIWGGRACFSIFVRGYLDFEPPLFVEKLFIFYGMHGKRRAAGAGNKTGKHNVDSIAQSACGRLREASRRSASTARFAES